MPFDGTPSEIKPLDTALARMELLQEIAAKASGDQRHFHSCLWSEVRRDERLLVAGLSAFDRGAGDGPNDRPALAKWFGFGPHANPWGSGKLSDKRRAIARRLATLREEDAHAV